MVNMAETESMFLVAGSRLGVNGGTTDTGSEDSDLEPGPVVSFQQTKRNKRKNFQPRNISYCEDSLFGSGGGSAPRHQHHHHHHHHELMEDYALDLSSSEPISTTATAATISPITTTTARISCSPELKRARLGDISMTMTAQVAQVVPLDDVASPIDLSCSKSDNSLQQQQQQQQHHHQHLRHQFLIAHQHLHHDEQSDSDEAAASSDSDCAVGDISNCDVSSGAGDCGNRSLSLLKANQQETPKYLLQQAFLHHHSHHPQPTDASDIREYAQNTVKELLEIYGLDTAEVAESITNNVPIANFSSGKILESLRPGCVDGKSPLDGQHPPPTPPHSPRSPPHLVHHHHHHHSRTKDNGQNTVPVSSTASIVCNVSKSSPASSQTNFPPRMVLPQNMATILALTAIQERQSGTPGSAISGPATPSSTPSTSSAGGTPKDLSVGAQSTTTIVLGRDQNSPAGRENKNVTPMDYSRYVRRFANSVECGNQYCKELNYREHFHCLDCNSRVFVKKEEMIRHFKWHKKRDESLQHGFMRYSPSDDCSDRYPNCGHNRKQTHYHCIQGTCDKVYISTSDVQMHANYHRKDSAIIQEGFQRLRATEECRTPYCAFFGQRTTHFHCRRDHCQFTFKNKADMEKHKTYHIKDEQLARDGFKKFLKPDPCGFPNCRFSQVCNHIHCVRDGCSYVLHSSGQLLSHKRKHERKDSEIAYRKFKLAQQAVVNIGSNECLQHGEMQPGGSSLQLLHQASSLAALNAMNENFNPSPRPEGSVSPKLPTTPQFKITPATTPPGFLDQSTSSQEYCDDEFTRYISSYSAGQPCQISCPLSNSEHYHCREYSCELPFRCRETAEGHARMHEAQERVSDFYQESSSHCPGTCPNEKHYHCTWDGCSDIVMPSERLEHFRSHEISAQHNNTLDSLFRRKRGRPPKNRIIEVWNDYASGGMADTPQAIFTSFKLSKPPPIVSQNSDAGSTAAASASTSSSPITITPVNDIKPAVHSPTSHPLEMQGFQPYNGPCPDPLCGFSVKSQHFHCSRPRCFFATDSEEFLVAHARDFHDNIDILDGFLFFDRSVDCRIESCASNKINRHFHCIKPGCGYSFVRYSHMAIHEAEHRQAEVNEQQLSPSSHQSQHSQNQSRRSPTPQQPTDLSENNEKEVTTIKCEPLIHQSNHDKYPEEVTTATNTNRPTVVRASGTFYPLCGVPSPPPPITETVKPEVIKKEPGTEASPHAQQQQFPEWMSIERHERYGPEVTCSRPFCKLKRKEHYHCNACNQAFSEVERLKPHIAKHSPSAIPPVMVKTENNNNEENNQQPHHGINILPLNLESQDGSMMHPPHFPGFSAAMAAAVANQQLAMITSQGIPFMPHGMPGLYTSPSGLMFTGPPGFAPHHSSLVNNGLLESARASMLCGDASPESLLPRNSISPQRDMSAEAKKARVQTSMRMLKDEPVPDGYLRFRFNEDCRYSHCGYREHQTHFHCMRQDCGYSFCDKTRFVQHTARHERLDTLMGGDFQQYRANVSCGRADCSYASTIGSSQNKASHFHCLKCEFVCTDTNKVVAHRRQHQKLDSIMAAGFEKFTPSQQCSSPDTCVHNDLFKWRLL
ncbi:zinc finger protein castor homolog 1-like isoform X3 [Rhodnius prolixus]|uniref:zinc finger protein castor homolog 1-like isoform X3 n=1 Tax=Rhodnius prolixus TaxID=13249 RepID=UPI003D187C01